MEVRPEREAVVGQELAFCDIAIGRADVRVGQTRRFMSSRPGAVAPTSHGRSVPMKVLGAGRFTLAATFHAASVSNDKSKDFHNTYFRICSSIGRDCRTGSELP